VSWTAKSTNYWVGLLDKAGVSRNLLESAKTRKLTCDNRQKDVREFGEADNARNITRISHKRQTENNTDGQHSPIN